MSTRVSFFSIKGLLKLLGHVVEVALVAGLVLVAATSFFPSKDFGIPYRIFTVMSGSMEPAISTGSIVVTTKASDAQPDQVIVFEDPRSNIPNSFVAHRVKERVEQDGKVFFRTKGDANESDDRYLAETNDLIGQVLFSIPKLGYLSSFAKTPKGLILLIVVPGVLLILYEIHNIKKAIEDHYKKQYERKKDDTEVDDHHAHAPKTVTSMVLLAFTVSSVFVSMIPFSRASFFSEVFGRSFTFATGTWGDPEPSPSPTVSPSPSASPSGSPTPSPSPSPTAPTGLHFINEDGDEIGCAGTTNNRSVDIEWDDSSNSLIYRYWIKQVAGPASFLDTDPGEEVPLGPPDHTTLQSFFNDNLPNQDGTYTIQVREYYSDDTYGDWSQECSVTLDRKGPGASMSVSSSPTRDIEERVTNGGFEDGLANWQVTEGITVVEGNDNGVAPFQSKMAKIQTSQVAILSQDLQNTLVGHGLRSISFAYNFASYEDSLNQMEPGFMVFAGDELVYQEWASEHAHDGNPDTLDAAGWQTLTVDLTYVDDPTLTLAFYGGSNPAKPATIYVDEVSTNVAVVNSQAIFHLTSTDNMPGDTVYYRFVRDGQVEEFSGPSPLEFSLTSAIDTNQIEYWATDELGNVEARKKFVVYFDDTKPEAITDLQLENMDEGYGILQWTAPGDSNPFGRNQASSYQIRYSQTPIPSDMSKEAWDALPQPALLDTQGEPLSGPEPPRAQGLTEVYGVVMAEDVSHYYFAVRAKDRAGNRSDLLEGSQVHVVPVGEEPPIDVPEVATSSAELIATSSAAPSSSTGDTPQVELAQLETSTLQFVVSGVLNYTKAVYELIYDHATDDSIITDGLTDELELDPAVGSALSPDLYLGTCSSNGEVCVPHLDVTNIHLKVTLTGQGVEEITLEDTL